MSPGEARTSKTLEEEQLFKIEETIHHHPSLMFRIGMMLKDL
jgi:hypothetical protein